MPPDRSNRHAERNLLFAGLGLTLGLLNRDKVIKAFTEWMLDKNLSLGDLLVEQKAITPEQKAVIEGAVEGQIEKEGNEEAALASLRNAKDLESDLDHLKDSDIQQSMVAVKARQSLNPALQSMGGLDLDPYQTTLPEPPKPEAPSNDRFQRKDFLDAGALGEVWFARDTELNRTVVVKYIKPEQATNPLNKALFYLEGEVTGYLEHPNIAPVYGLGKDHQDRNYYAMRYIQGRKLTKAIHEYHAIPTKESGKRQETLIGLLQSFQSACLAVEYAHSRGVIHCDLKPDNILLGQFGETMVVDWGLVLVKGDLNLPSVEEGKTIGPDELPTTNPQYRPSQSASGGLHERQGGIRNYVGGTPAYMAPEQLKATLGGDVDAVTSSSDVFALGSVLYEILTNRAPLLPYKDKKETRKEYYERVEKGIFPNPRSVIEAIPKPLESIVLKAMGLTPKDRYSSARDLSEDVKRWISDEPVSAHKEGLKEKSTRWLRRNKPLATGALVFLTFITMGSLAFGIITTGYNNQLILSESRVKSERDKAIQNELVAKKEKANSLKNEIRASRLKDQSEGLLYSLSIQNASLFSDSQKPTSFHAAMIACSKRLINWEYIFLWSNFYANRGEIRTDISTNFIKYTNKDNQLAVTSNNAVNFYNNNGEIAKSLSLPSGVKGKICALCDNMFCVFEDGRLQVYDAKNGKIVNEIVTKNKTGTPLVNENFSAFMQYSDGFLSVFGLPSGKIIYTHKNISMCPTVNFSATGEYFYAFAENGLEIRSSENGSVVKTLKFLNNEFKITEVTTKWFSVNPNETEVAVLSNDGSLKIIQFDGNKSKNMKLIKNVTETIAFPNSAKIDYSNDGNTIFIKTNEKVVVLSARTGFVLGSYFGHSQLIDAVFDKTGFLLECTS